MDAELPPADAPSAPAPVFAPPDDAVASFVFVFAPAAVDEPEDVVPTPAPDDAIDD